MSSLAVGAFWFAWGRTGNIEVEGWLVYGYVLMTHSTVRLHRPLLILLPLPPLRSKVNPLPHSYIFFSSDSIFPQDVAYDVDVELELVRPKWSEDGSGQWALMYLARRTTLI